MKICLLKRQLLNCYHKNVVSKNYSCYDCKEVKTLKCFATVGCGDETLRSFFKGTLDKETLKRGILCYQDIQNATSSFLDLFLQRAYPIGV